MRACAAPFIAAALLAIACQGPSPSPSGPAPAATPPVDPLKAAIALEEGGQRVAAYQAYAALVQTLPQGDRRSSEARERAQRLGFLLGIPQGPGAATHNLPPGQVDPARVQAVEEARALYHKAVAHQDEGETQAALEGYTQVLKAVEAKEDPELYWNAYQRVGELSPEAPSRAQGEGDEWDEGDEAPATGKALIGRQAYMRGMSLERSGQYIQAREAFEEALENLRGEDDLQLVEAAEGHLNDVRAKLKELNPR